MPFKQVDTYTSKMTYAVDWNKPRLMFHDKLPQYASSRDYWSLSYEAVGVRLVKAEFEITYGKLRGVRLDTLEDVTNWDIITELKPVFMERYDTRYGIDWVAKLSGKDDIKLSGGESSFSQISKYFDKLREIRSQLLVREPWQSPSPYEGWYQNA